MDFKNMEMSDVGYTIRVEQDRLYSEQKAYEAANPVLAENAVIDEEQSVRWNREEVQRRNNSRKAKLAAYKRKRNELDSLGIAEVKRRIREDYGFTDMAVDLIFQKAYAHDHSYGLGSVYTYACDLADFVSEIIDATT